MYFLNKAYIFQRTSLLRIWGKITSTKSDCFSSQVATGFKNTAVEFAWSNNDRDLFILEIQPQNPHNCKWQYSERVSQTFVHSYLSYLVCSYWLSSWILATGNSTSLQKHSVLRPHDFAQRKFRLTIVTCTRKQRICEINPDIQDLMHCIVFWKSEENFDLFADDVRQRYPDSPSYFTESFQFTNLAEVRVSWNHAFPFHLF